ncbi:MAG TPA: M12 family metallo-peptidase [Ignavibacteriaceae bacterium]|jgi:hypothetical protein|nr:M12 family metallo-peptidase [Ignavibacteriaceae bacterium]
MKKSFTFILLLLISGLIFAQNNYWSDINENQISVNSERYIIPDAYRTVSLNVSEFKSYLAFAPIEFNNRAMEGKYIISLPMPDGTFQDFNFWESPTMEAELQEQFPEIRTYTGQGIDDPFATLKFDFTSLGFHAQILSPNGRVFIDPYSLQDIENYISYYTKDFKKFNDNFTCELYYHGEYQQPENLNENFSYEAIGPQLRTYRLANAATGEYTQFFGGSVSQGLAAVTTTVNRVNGVYEREVGIRMILVANNSLIIYTNPSTDPYTNNNGSTMLGQNISNLNSVIGSGNYDIGHVFSTGGGGVAYLGCVCTSSKAGGVTGSSSPVGDPFDIDYVAHEMGHQFGANHTFNGTLGSCSGSNRNASTAYEPGSGSTIMAYAGICYGDDLQPHSDPYFHTISYSEIVAYTNSGSGNSCAVISNTGNNAPVVTVPAGGFYIPKSTPFALTGSATDPNGDALTYCWEEFDLGPAGSPNSPSGTAPIFRSWSPSSSPTRTFPRLSDLINNTTVIGEILPTYSRAMNFRLTARDNKAGGGGVDYKQMSTFYVDGNSGPFVVTSPNTNVSWYGNSQQTITWNVANTSSSPVNCSNVKILLSTDGGYNFNTVLVASTPNDGSEIVTIPNTPTSQARIKVEAIGNIFFDISNINFKIIASPIPDNPVSFEATLTSASQINLSFTTNSTNDNVVIIWNQTGVFTSPSGTPPSVGGAFAGGTLLYNGKTSPVVHSGLSANTTYYYKAFSYNGVNYSSGITADATTLLVQNPISFAAIAINNSSIFTSFTQNLALNNVVIVWNNTGSFSSPVGVPPSVGQPFAGGVLFYMGNSSPQIHSGLNSNTEYYYKIFSYDGISYSEGLIDSAKTLSDTQSFQIAITVNDGWNMVSIPGLHPQNQNVDTWWQYRNQFADVYYWDAALYVSTDILTPAVGYWMLHDGYRVYNTGDEWPASGIQYSQHDPISVNSGWNMIGCYEQKIPVTGLTTTPPGLISPNTIYTWDNGYIQPDTLIPGTGYWILLNGNGVINYDMLAKNNSLKKTFEKENWGKIIFTDAANKTYILYLIDGNVDLDYFQLPPLPPEGLFDIRFNSGRFVESIDKRDLAIEMRGVKYPVNITVEKASINLQDINGNIIYKDKDSGGRIILDNSSINKLIVKKNELPESFALEQNFPNPFNPSTKIKFTIPQTDNPFLGGARGALVTLKVYDILGNEITTLINEEKLPGIYEVEFNSHSDEGQNLSSGTYFYTLRAGNFVQTKKMIVIK